MNRYSSRQPLVMNHRRIGLELFGTQTASRDRGIGRYVRNLTAALLNQGPSEGYEFLLYAEDGPPTNLPASFPLTLLRPEPTVRDTVNRLTLTNPDQLDVLLFLNPLELTPGFDIPTRSPRGPKLAAIIYDLIPLIFQDDYLRKWPGSQYARRYLSALERLRTYDILLAISEATRLDTIRLLNVVAREGCHDRHGWFGLDVFIDSCERSDRPCLHRGARNHATVRLRRVGDGPEEEPRWSDRSVRDASRFTPTKLPARRDRQAQRLRTRLPARSRGSTWDWRSIARAHWSGQRHHLTCTLSKSRSVHFPFLLRGVRSADRRGDGVWCGGCGGS